MHAKLVAATDSGRARLHRAARRIEKRFADVEQATLRRSKLGRPLEPSCLNATETRIVVTGNYRAWRHFVAMRASEHADIEIRGLAIACLRELRRVAPNVIRGLRRITTLPDGTEIASSPLVSEASREHPARGRLPPEAPAVDVT